MRDEAGRMEVPARGDVCCAACWRKRLAVMAVLPNRRATHAVHLARAARRREMVSVQGWPDLSGLARFRLETARRLREGAGLEVLP